MVDDHQLESSKAIHRRTGKTFYYATRLLPERVRHSTYVLYAFFRIADEIVDEAAGASPDTQRAQLERLRRGALGGETGDPVLSAFQDVATESDIPDAEVHAFVDAMSTDITKRRYADHEELASYMRGSSISVAFMMLAVMDPDDPERARPHARALGEAFQLTNFLRDVREDIVERDRVYLPQTTLEDHGVTDDQLRSFETSEGFVDAMRAELRRTEALYRAGVAGIRYLPEDCQFPVLLSAVLYADHHRLIRARGFDVLTETPALGTARKLWLVARTRWHWTWTGDPESAFYRASAVSGHGDSQPPERSDPVATR